MSDNARSRDNPAEIITQAIIERLEAGTRPWVRPWDGAGISRPLRACGTPYQGINVFWLWMVSDMRGFGSPFWMTYKRAGAEGGQVRKGERGSLAVFYKSLVGTTAHDHDDEPGSPRRILKTYTVFNADQIDGLPARFRPEPPEPCNGAARDPVVAAFFDAIPASLRHHGAEAYYEPVIDRITMPGPQLFGEADHYHATLAHELAHWTGHSSRLVRDLNQRFGTEAYAMEELVAELASALIGSALGLPVAHLDHHASYVASWLKVLKADSRAVLSVAAKAEQAAQLLLRLGGHSSAPADPLQIPLAA